MENSKIFMFPEAGTKSSIDPTLLALMNNNGGFGGNNWIWIFFLWMIWGWGGNGFGNGFGGNNGFLANQMANGEGRDLLLQAINGRADALGQLAQITNSNVEQVQAAVNTISTGIQNVSAQVGMSGLHVTNAIQSGDAALSRQLCECCCENRLAIANQTNALQSQAASNFAAQQLEVCQQTNALTTQADRNTRSITDAIAALQTNMTHEFCDIREREMQSKIDTQGDIITQLRNQISNDNQTIQFNAAFRALDDKIDAIAAKQPNTVPVTWPNLTAVNNTPYAAGALYGFGWNNGWGSNSFWN